MHVRRRVVESLRRSKDAPLVPRRRGELHADWDAEPDTGQDRDDIVANGGVRNRDGSTAEKGGLITAFNPNADGSSQDTPPSSPQ